MRRAQAGARTDAFTNTHDSEQGFWPSFADMMSSIALVLFFLMLLAYIQNLVTGNQLTSTKEELANTAAQLQETLGQVTDAQGELTSLNQDLADVRASLALEQEQLEQSVSTIQGQEQLIQWQQEYIDATSEDLYSMKAQMQTIALLRLSVLERVKDAIEQVLGEESSVTVSDNGSIILGESLFFEYDSATVTKEGKALLNELANAFYIFLSSPDNAQYVDSIVISGHTDNRGTASYNRDLSTRRANAVLDYLLEESGVDLSAHASQFSAAGYGATRPIAPNETDEGRRSNRRIEISIILRDESILKIVDEYLSESLPG